MIYSGNPGAPAESLALRRDLVVEALKYIKKFAGTRAVIKYGGAAMVQPDLKRSFAQDVVLLQAAGLRPLIVHGGGPEISRTLERLGQKSEFVDGQRVTGSAEMGVVEMVLTGKVNTDLVGLINTLGGSAMGMSGKDAHLIRARKQAPRPGKPDLGLVGEVESINDEVLSMLLDKQYIPVISPIGLGSDGTSYNINADHVAAEIAVAAQAKKLIFLTDVPGVLDETGQLLSQLTTADLHGRLQDGKAVKGGMAVKSKAVLRALEGGVEAVHVV
ncbi:MAG: acetylglutamate kinase, partial [Deltaproteobacteria bacterium]|nr:acetylglutamate kinase [Deltaproteobacteria bacterium]